MPSTVNGIHYGLHGRVGNLSAENVRHEIVETENGTAVEVVGRVAEASIGSPTLVLNRRLLVSTDRPEVRIEDTVTNEGFTVAGHMFRHHFNLGFPAVQRNSVVVSTAQPVGLRDPGQVPALPWVLQDDSGLEGAELDEMVVYCRPTGESVSTRISDPDGRWIEIGNPSASWPFLILWRDPRPGVNVLGVEPSTSKDAGRAQAETDGEVLWLEPGQNVRYLSTVTAGTRPL